MICEQQTKKYCKDDISKIENYYKAIADNSQTWHCHHRDEIRFLPSGMVALRSKQELVENGRYYNCPANELIFLTHNEHRILHRTNTFGRKFKEHYGITKIDNELLYLREYKFYRRHNCTVRWEIEK